MSEAFIQQKAKEAVIEVYQMHLRICTGEVKDGWVYPKKGTNEEARRINAHGKIRCKYERLMKQIGIKPRAFNKFFELELKKPIVGDDGDGDGEEQ